MTNKKLTALITGGNKGIGFETARQMAQQGYTVWVGSRDHDRGTAAVAELAADGDVRLVDLDVTDDDSVKAAAEHISDESGALDVLVNNAGIAFGESEELPGAVSADMIQAVLDVNFFGALRVTQTFLPLVQRAEQGRIVNVSSGMASLTTLTSPNSPLEGFKTFAYPASKTMLNTLTGWLATELDGTTVKVNSVCPGSNATDMTGHQGAQPPSEGAKIVVTAATLPADGPSGAFFDASGPVPW